MAYNFIPTSEQEIQKSISNVEALADAVVVFRALTSKYPAIKDPLAFDLSKPKAVKVIRQLSSSIDLKEYQKLCRYVRLEFGSGSRGGRGAGNKGNIFEKIFAHDIENWFIGEELADPTNLPLIEEIDKIHNLSKYKNIKAKFIARTVGEANTKRPLNYGSRISLGRGPVDIGADVSDINLEADGKLIAHLSMKFGPTVTFFNAGTLKSLPTKQVEAGLVTTDEGKRLLEMMGLDNAWFCSIFNGNKSARGLGKPISPDTAGLEYLLQCGIGYGYTMVHKNKNNSKVVQITPSYMRTAAKISRTSVRYGGAGGNAKKVEVIVTTPKYQITFNFRDSSGNNRGYPTRVMADYKYV